MHWSVPQQFQMLAESNIHSFINKVQQTYLNNCCTCSASNHRTQ